MNPSKPLPATVDEYIASFPENIRTRLNELRAAIKKGAPKADEIISYGMAGYKHNGAVAYFAGYKTHIGLYPRMAEFKKELEKYEGSKGTVKFKIDEPIPSKLVTQMIKFQVIKNQEKALTKKSGKK